MGRDPKQNPTLSACLENEAEMSVFEIP